MPDPKPEFDLSQAVADANKNYFAPRRLDIEDAISSAPDFDLNVAWEIFSALKRRLEQRYEDALDAKVSDAMKAMDRALAQAEEIEPDPNWDEDQIADDPRSHD